MKARLQKLFYMTPVTSQEIINIVNSNPNKTPMDCFDINFTLITETITLIALPLTQLANISFEKGIFPQGMKLAKVIPLFKAGQKDAINNYRPVSLLPQFSKIFEKLFNKRLYTFLEDNKILSD